jgi:tRNA uridine 5-carboxymethylaminomethyl modification enzyme
MRLTEQGRALGLVDDARWQHFGRKRDAIAQESERLKNTWVNPQIITAAEAERVLGKALEHEYSLGELLRRPNVGYTQLMGLQTVSGQTAAALPAKSPTNTENKTLVSHETSAFSFLGLDEDLRQEVVEQIEISFKYAGYIDKQKEEIARLAAQESVPLPMGFDYMAVDALSIEVRQKLTRHKPATLGQASRISGVTPAAVSLLLIYLKKKGGKR